mmetsp:Transcript_19387/g.39421  ORF Transcript_19387/g.39421 Transcript_19387/m.39421 type:complete len:212 (+) Transcript_19387:293-928(+)
MPCNRTARSCPCWGGPPQCGGWGLSRWFSAQSASSSTSWHEVHQCGSMLCHHLMSLSSGGTGDNGLPPFPGHGVPLRFLFLLQAVSGLCTPSRSVNGLTRSACATSVETTTPSSRTPVAAPVSSVAGRPAAGAGASGGTAAPGASTGTGLSGEGATSASRTASFWRGDFPPLPELASNVFGWAASLCSPMEGAGAFFPFAQPIANHCAQET